MSPELSTGPDERGSWWEAIKRCSGTKADRRNQYWFSAWAFAWAISFVAANWFIGEHNPAGGLLWLVASAPILFAVAALLAYMHFLHEADELLRKIQIDGLAFGFGAALIFTSAYSLFEVAGAPPADMFMVMIAAWMIGMLVGTWRYR